MIEVLGGGGKVPERLGARPWVKQLYFQVEISCCIGSYQGKWGKNIQELLDQTDVHLVQHSVSQW